MVWCFDLNSVKNRIISHKNTELKFSNEALEVSINSEDNQQNSAGFMLAWETRPEAFYKLNLKANLKTGDRAFVFVETSDFKDRLVPRNHWIHQGETLTESIIFQAKSDQVLLGILFYQKNQAYQLEVEQFELHQTRARTLSDLPTNIPDKEIMKAPTTLTELALARLEALKAKQSPKPIASLNSASLNSTSLQSTIPVVTKIVEMKSQTSPVAKSPQANPQASPQVSPQASPHPPQIPSQAPKETQLEFFHPNPPKPDFQASKDQIRIRRVRSRFGTPNTLLSKFTGQRIYVVIHPNQDYEAGRDWMDYQLRSRGFEYFLVKGILPNSADYQKQVQTNGPNFSKQIPSPQAWAQEQTYRKILEDANRQRLDKILLLESDCRFHRQMEKQLSLILNHKEPLQAPTVFLGWNTLETQLSTLQTTTQAKSPFFFLETGHPITITNNSLAVMISRTVYQPLLEHWKTNGIRNHFVLSLQTQSLKLKVPSLVVSPGLIQAPEIKNSNSNSELNQEDFPSLTLSQYRNWKHELQNRNFSLRQALRSAPDYINSSHLRLIPEPYFGWAPIIEFLERSTGLFKMDLINLIEGYPIPMALVVPSYNNAKNYQKNLQSIFAQDYQNYRVIYVDDNSTDQTSQLVTNFVQNQNQAGRSLIVRQRVNQKQGSARYWAYHQAYPDELVVLLDGDDWFPHNQVLTVLDSNYQKYNLMTSYGSFYTYNGQKTNWNGLSGQGTFPQKIIDKKRYRTFRWTSQHLRTGWGALFQQIRLGDLWHTNGRFFTTSTDCAESYPLLEMAGDRHRNLGLGNANNDNNNSIKSKVMNTHAKNKLARNKFLKFDGDGSTETKAYGLYVYNQDNSLIYDNSYYNLEKKGNQAQKDYHQQVQDLLKSRPVYQTVNPTIRYNHYHPEPILKLNLLVRAEIWPLLQLPEDWIIVEQQRIWSDQIPESKAKTKTKSNKMVARSHSVITTEPVVEVDSAIVAVGRRGPPGPKGLPAKKSGPFFNPDDSDDEDPEPILPKSITPKAKIQVWVRVVEGLIDTEESSNLNQSDSLNQSESLKNTINKVVSYVNLPAPQTIFLYSREPVVNWSQILHQSKWLKRTRADVFHFRSGRDHPKFTCNQMTPTSIVGGYTTNIVGEYTTSLIGEYPTSLSGEVQIQAFTFNQKYLIPLSIDGLYLTSSLQSNKFQIGLSVGSPLGDTIDLTINQIFKIKAPTITYQPSVPESTVYLVPELTTSPKVVVNDSPRKPKKIQSKARVRQQKNRIVPRIQNNGIAERPSFDKVIRIQPASRRTAKTTGLPGIQNHYIKLGARK